MPKILIAGATGYLGRYLVRAYKQAGYHVRVLVRDKKKLKSQGPNLEPPVNEYIDEVWIGDVTDRASIQGICAGMDVVCSAVGLTRQKTKLTFDDVDYLGNLNLLREAEMVNVDAFMYIHVFGAEQMDNPGLNAKRAFVEELRSSKLTSMVIKPTGYFSDMAEYLKMAQKGRVYLIVDGKNQLNPIHGEDVASLCVRTMEEGIQTEVEIGGPSAYTHREIAELAFQVLNKDERLTTLPSWMIRSLIPFVKIGNPKQYAFLAFFLDVMTKDLVAESQRGKDLQTFYQDYLHYKKQQGHRS